MKDSKFAATTTSAALKSNGLYRVTAKRMKAYDVKQIFEFLHEIKMHNEVEWMHKHKAMYIQAKKTFEALSGDILNQMTLVDPLLSGLALKQCVFRFARDTRFSWDKSPYKTHFGLYLCPGGKKRVGAGYYLHLQPTDPDGEYFSSTTLDVGVHCPPTPAAKIIRQYIYENGDQLQKFLNSTAVKKSGYRIFDEERLKVLPKQWKESPYDSLIRLKNWDLFHPVSDKQALASDFIPYIIEVFRIGKEWNDFFNQALDETRIQSIF